MSRLKYVILPGKNDRPDVFFSRLTDLITPGKIISIVGSGGKTSTMLALGKELASKNSPVIMSTTTRILPFEEDLPENLQCIASPAENNKLKAPENLVYLPDLCDHLIIEADGSRQYPIKMPAGHEPAIFPASDQIIGVFGLKGIGQKISNVCHRPEIVCHFLGKSENEVITADDAAKIITSPYGLSKNIEKCNFIIILNQADTTEDIQNAKNIAGLLPPDILCIFTSYE